MIQVKDARSRVLLYLFPLLFFLLVPFAVPLQAGNPDDDTDIRISEPRVFIGAHLGVNFPQASSDIYHMVTRVLTLEKSDFNAPMVGFDLGLPFQSRFAAVFSFEYSRTSTTSEYRDYVEANGDPITQNTRLSLVPVTGTLRFYPRKMGEEIGSYAWVPNRVLPYIGAGAGFVHYNFKQRGDFVDEETLTIFSTSFESSGTPLIKHVVAGVDIGLSSNIFANLEARYSWAEADLSRDFIGFEPIDLSGLRAVGGLYFRF